MFALVDCNNFYVSCERAFQLALNGVPVVILSNNDGCIVSRSAEAKALGFKVGDPLFQVRPLVEQHQVKVFSSNYRPVRTCCTLCPAVSANTGATPNTAAGPTLVCYR